MRKILQTTLSYGAYHKLSKIAKLNWTQQNFGVLDQDGTFYLHHDAGFFSNCSVTLFELARSKQIIKCIDVSKSFTWFKENQNENVWGNFFSPPILRQTKRYGYWGETLLHHNQYRKLNLKIIEPILNSYFHPSEMVLSRQLELIKKYEIDPSKILAVNYRGTDKVLEVASTSIDKWINITKKRLASLSSQTRVLIQTDQQQVLQRFTEEFGERSFSFVEMPVTSGSKVIHETLEVNERNNFAINLLASTLIISHCHSVVTHTGNVAFWTVLFRGSKNNLTQI